MVAPQPVRRLDQAAGSPAPQSYMPAVRSKGCRPHDLWLIADATITAVTLNSPCNPEQDDSDRRHRAHVSMNPHLAIHFPDEYLLDGREILADFDAHCHERWTLDGGTWAVNGPVRLLTQKEQAEFSSTRFGPPPPKEISAKYKGAPALYSFSGVYFNH